MTRLGMVIDLAKCVGCGACAFACKTENNTRTRGGGQSHNWADFIMRTEGTFPNVTHFVMPVLCNHCTDAPCIKACPVKPNKAIFKTPEGITLTDPELCIGCRQCQEACPYSHDDLDGRSLNGETYSVISYNAADKSTQPYWTDKSAPAIAGCTSTGAEVAAKTGTTTPAMNVFKSGDAQPIRKGDVVEKCTFCHHRTLNGLQPACVEVCPSQARVFGDQEDPASRISQILKNEKSFRLQEEKGTKPNVHYVGKYSARA
jgi:Fe-S-cluster-containing dehydrogenase component